MEVDCCLRPNFVVCSTFLLVFLAGSFGATKPSDLTTTRSSANIGYATPRTLRPYVGSNFLSLIGDRNYSSNGGILTVFKSPTTQRQTNVISRHGTTLKPLTTGLIRQNYTLNNYTTTSIHHVHEITYGYGKNKSPTVKASERAVCVVAVEKQYGENREK